MGICGEFRGSDDCTTQNLSEIIVKDFKNVLKFLDQNQEVKQSLEEIMDRAFPDNPVDFAQWMDETCT